MVVIGGSGTGKSVLIKHMIGLLRPTGAVPRGRRGGEARRERSRRAEEEVRDALPGAALFDSLTVWENVGFNPSGT